MKTELITLPTFTFPQPNDEPIRVIYFGSGIELQQGEGSVILLKESLDPLIAEIKGHWEEAEEALNYMKRL